jgi:hypothetical protein
VRTFFAYVLTNVSKSVKDDTFTDFCECQKDAKIRIKKCLGVSRVFLNTANMLQYFHISSLDVLTARVLDMAIRHVTVGSSYTFYAEMSDGENQRLFVIRNDMRL